MSKFISLVHPVQAPGDMSLVEAIQLDLLKLGNWLRMLVDVDFNWDALSAIGGLGSALVAVGALISTAVSFSHQKKREVDFSLEEQRMRRKEQAGRFVAWCDSGDMHIDNRSDLPIYDVYAFVVNGTPGVDAHEGDSYLDVVPPNSSLRLSFKSGPPKWDGNLNRYLRVLFKDANDVTWERVHRGGLREVSPSVYDDYGADRSVGYFERNG